jgi:hypothetical protein
MRMRITGWFAAIQNSLGLGGDGATALDEARAAVGVRPADAQGAPATVAEQIRTIAVAATRDPRPEHGLVHLDAADLLEDLLRIPPAAWSSVFSAAALRGLLIGLTEVVALLRRVSGEGPERAATELAALASRCRVAHADGVLRMSAAAAPFESSIRWLAWALDTPPPWSLRLALTSCNRVMRALDRMNASVEAPVLVVWACETAVPAPVIESARVGVVQLLVPEALAPESVPGAWKAVGGAHVDGLSLEPGVPRVGWLSATAAIVQAILGGHRTGWVHVCLPQDVFRLEVLPGVRDARRALEQRCVGMLRFAQGSREFVVPPLFVPRGA